MMLNIAKVIGGLLILAAWIWGAVHAWHSGEWLVTVVIAALFALGIVMAWLQLRRPRHHNQ